MNGDICCQDQQDKFKFHQILPNGYQKINGLISIASFMVLDNLHISKELKIILLKIIKIGNDYLIVQLLINRYFQLHIIKY